MSSHRLKLKPCRAICSSGATWCECCCQLLVTLENERLTTFLSTQMHYTFKGHVCTGFICIRAHIITRSVFKIIKLLRAPELTLCLAGVFLMTLYKTANYSLKVFIPGTSREHLLIQVAFDVNRHFCKSLTSQSRWFDGKILSN